MQYVDFKTIFLLEGGQIDEIFLKIDKRVAKAIEKLEKNK